MTGVELSILVHLSELDSGDGVVISDIVAESIFTEPCVQETLLSLARRRLVTFASKEGVTRFRRIAQAAA